jgi:hypothetical protein
VRGLLIGLVLLFVVALSALSLRPGGLRNQFRNMARRLRLALILVGIYLLVSSILRLAFPNSVTAEWAMGAIAVVLGITFVVLGQDRQLQR